MTTQPEALRLANYIEKCDRCGGTKAAAAELRRLHNELEREKVSRQAAQAENEDLKARLARAGLERQQAVLTKDALLRQALEMLVSLWNDGLEGTPVSQHQAAMDAIRHHLEGKA